jgi:hypothetical protein
MRLGFGIRRLLLSPSSGSAVQHRRDRCCSSNPVANPPGYESVASTRGCRINPQRPYWSRSQGRVANAASRGSREAGPARLRPAQPSRAVKSRSVSRAFSPAALCDSLTCKQSSRAASGARA